jgi:hypothetical protein
MPDSHQIFTGGYYNLDIAVLEWAQHTYVLAGHGSASEVKFQCYGSCDPALREQGSKYPAELYKPQLVFDRRTYGEGVLGNLSLARGIACGDAHAAPRKDYDQKDGGRYGGLGDCCGLIYAVNGVCHHMAARILWACDNTPILWPPSVYVSALVWGFYGNNWEISKPFFEKMRTSVYQQSLRNVQDEVEMHDLTDLMRQSAQAAVALEEQPELRGARAQAVPAAADVSSEMVRFRQFKAGLDRQLLKGTVSRKEYAEQLNKRFRATMVEMKDRLSPEDYQSVFGLSPEEPEAQLAIDESMIPDNLADLKLID